MRSSTRDRQIAAVLTIRQRPCIGDTALDQANSDYDWYARKLNGAAEYFPGARGPELVSIKLRFLDNYDASREAYLGGEAYLEFDRFIGEFDHPRPIPTFTSARPIQLSDGTIVVVEKHENGPEIIFWLGSVTEIAHTATAVATAVGAAGGAGLVVVKFINAVADLFARFRKTTTSGRQRLTKEVKGLSVEKRTTKTAKTVRKIRTDAKTVRRAIEKVSELID